MDQQERFFRIFGQVIAFTLVAAAAVSIWAYSVGKAKDVIWPPLMIAAGAYFTVGALFLHSSFGRGLLGSRARWKGREKSRRAWFLVMGLFFLVWGVFTWLSL